MKKMILSMLIVGVLVLGQADAAVQQSKPFTQARMNLPTLLEGPDLTVTGLCVYPAAHINGSTSFIAIVKNIGSVRTPATRAFMRVGGETYPQEYAIPPLNPGASQTLRRWVRLTKPQYYRVTVKADSLNQAREVNERNNERYKDFSVGRLNDPIIPLQVTSTNINGANQSLVPYSDYRGKVLFIVNFNIPVSQDSLQVGRTIIVDIRCSSGQARYNIAGEFRLSANLKQMVFVSSDYFGHLLRIGSGDNLEFKITLRGTDNRGTGVILDNMNQQALDGDKDNQAGGDFTWTGRIVT